MTFIKKLLVTAALMLSLVSSFGAIAPLTQSAAGSASILTNGCEIFSLTCVNATGSAITVRFVDNNTTNLVWTNTSYTVPYTYSTNLVTILTNNYLGNVTSTNTNTVLVTTSTTVAANTNIPFATLAVISIPANSSTTYRPVNPLNAWRGVAVTNSGAVDISVEYAPIK